ncbi:MAG: hypothetical protein O3C67_01745 [Cyanobacteria bacterium]|nr:hypothetical protein [Cyanobacteriota bacterium]
MGPITLALRDGGALEVADWVAGAEGQPWERREPVLWPPPAAAIAIAQ